MFIAKNIPQSKMHNSYFNAQLTQHEVQNNSDTNINNDKCYI